MSRLRGWGRINWNEAVSLRTSDSLKIGADRASGYGAMQLRTIPVNRNDSTTLGVFLPQAPDTTAFSFQKVQSGPDSGLVYFLNPPTVGPSYKIFVAPAIVRPLSYKGVKAVKDSMTKWQQRQIGHDSTGAVFDTANVRQFCNTTLLDSTLHFVKRHEGWTQASNSHWGIGDSVFAHTRVQDYLDRFVFPFDSTLKIRAKSAWEWYSVIFYHSWSPYTIPEKVFDRRNGTEYVAASQICTFLP